MEILMLSNAKTRFPMVRVIPMYLRAPDPDQLGLGNDGDSVYSNAKIPIPAVRAILV